MNIRVEVHDNIEVLNKQLQQSNKAVVYCRPKVAVWFVNEDFIDNLLLGKAVKIP